MEDTAIPSVPPVKRHPYDQWSPDARALDLVGDKWTLLIIRDLIPGPRRFVELQRVLPGISTEQLRSRLNRMVADGLLTRERFREVPPRVEYELTERARALVPVLGTLARWGYEWAWSAPRPKEAVDIGAILRLAPGLVLLDDDVTGSVECTVAGNDRSPEQRYLILVEKGKVTVHEHPGDQEPDARVTGKPSTWAQAFSPGGSLSVLDYSGDRTFAENILRPFSRGASRQNSAVPA